MELIYNQTIIIIITIMIIIIIINIIIIIIIIIYIINLLLQWLKHVNSPYSSQTRERACWGALEPAVSSDVCPLFSTGEVSISLDSWLVEPPKNIVIMQCSP